MYDSLQGFSINIYHISGLQKKENKGATLLSELPRFFFSNRLQL